MKRFPLQTLIQLREHRVETARLLVLQRQREREQCQQACTRIEGEIVALETEKGTQRRRMLDPPPPGIDWPSALAQREAHIDLLGLQAEAARERLRQAQEKLREAENALREAREAFFRAKARQDALEKRKDVWRGEIRAQELRLEEAANADLVLGRPVFVSEIGGGS
jgi:flagellar biosynthesis chaperone FliJ